MDSRYICNVLTTRAESRWIVPYVRYPSSGSTVSPSVTFVSEPRKCQQYVNTRPVILFCIYEIILYILCILNVLYARITQGTRQMASSLRRGMCMYDAACKMRSLDHNL